ncbi:serine hydrolase [Micromonospora eburnea]|uniref:Beta-lactamase n=1 Tax=Micromonospora eburnea TaxID=227316 RepID=A0A1C6UST8_9ACTN|nr:serine hydrolase [Micromonospora eburnea]SCL57076.1 Beta-lactamase enzyme family protein [Micromonospora eburnea]
MASKVNRRTALGLGTVATAGAVLGMPGPAMGAPGNATGDGSRTTTGGSPASRVAEAYQREKTRAGGNWYAYLSVAGAGGTPQVAAQERADTVVEAYSVNKIAVAVAVLDKVDRGLLTLDQRVEVTAAIVVPGGDGIFGLDNAYPSSVTLGHALAALLTVSDDTAVRLCGLVCPAAELNEILVAKGFPNTQVEPVANPNRFFLGTSTARETHNLLQALVVGTLLSPASTAFLINLLRSPIAFTDGIRRTMSSDERARVATKAGWFADARHEAGIIFDPAGAPVLTYVLFADGQAGADNFGATHPAVQARAAMGPKFLTAVSGLTNSAAPARRPRTYRPTNGG